MADISAILPNLFLSFVKMGKRQSHRQIRLHIACIIRVIRCQT
jgi:hypothetical protein